MKAKDSWLEWTTIAIVMILDIYLLNSFIGVNKYSSNKNNGSTANYIEVETKEDETSEIIVNNNDDNLNSDATKEESKKLLNSVVESLQNNLNKKEEIIEPEPIPEPDPIVYEGKTLNELAEMLEKSLNSILSGKGNLIASYSLEKGVDPVMATAIMLHETGCKWNCSYISTNCNNVGGQKGTGCGSYRYFNTLDEGIMGFIDNLSINYVSYGLTTPDLINPKYAEDPNWSAKVNKYMTNIKAQ